MARKATKKQEAQHAAKVEAAEDALADVEAEDARDEVVEKDNFVQLDSLTVVRPGVDDPDPK